MWLQFDLIIISLKTNNYRKMKIFAAPALILLASSASVDAFTSFKFGQSGGKAKAAPVGVPVSAP